MTDAPDSPCAAARRIVLITDFGPGIYVGQLRARLDALLPGLPVIDLVHDLPPCRPELAAWLLPALVRDLPAETLCICVVDPGVGGSRAGLVARTGGQWFLGPDNGLLAPLLRRQRARTETAETMVWRSGWRPERLSASFHGRDWFVPAAARLLQGQDLGLTPLADPADIVGADWPLETARILYADRFGNLMTGLQPPALQRQTPAPRLRAGLRMLDYARTFSAVPAGTAFWYENALGLVELAVNQGRADRQLGLEPGDAVGPFQS